MFRRQQQAEYFRFTLESQSCEALCPLAYGKGEKPNLFGTWIYRRITARRLGVTCKNLHEIHIKRQSQSFARRTELERPHCSFHLLPKNEKKLPANSQCFLPVKHKHVFATRSLISVGTRPGNQKPFNMNFPLKLTEILQK